MKYIINADDFGRTETVNEAIAEGFRLGYLTRTTIMVNMPYCEAAVKLAMEKGFFDKVGLHINLTSGYPLTEEIRGSQNFCDADGNFTGKIFRDRKIRFILSESDKRAVAKEVRAQIEKYNKLGFTLKHADSHGHVHTFPALLGIVIKELEIAEFFSLRISTNLSSTGLKKIYKSVINKRINLFNKNCCDYFDAYKQVLKVKDQLREKNLICEVMLHPNIWNGDMQIGQGCHYSDLDRLEIKNE